MSPTTRQLLAITENVVGDPTELQVALSCDPADPYAVVMDCHATSGVVSWMFSWDLLCAGVHTPAGIGDIHIRPGDPGRTEIVLQPSAASAVLTFLSSELIDFLVDTSCMEPPPIPDYVADIDFEAAS